MRIVMDAYEKDALRDIRAWENRKPGAVELALATGLQAMSDTMSSLRGAREVLVALEQALNGMISLLNDAAAASVRAETILAEFRENGHAVQGTEDIGRLPLQAVDRTVGYLSTKYTSVAATQGAAEGMGGLAALVGGVPLLTAWSLRAACEYATYYGFDLRLESERLYAMRVLNAASIVKMTPKLAFLGEMHKIAHELAVRQSWAVLHKNLFSRTVTSLGKSFGLRVTKAKLAQVVPVAGVFIAGGFNAWFVSEVCLTASMLYRKRFLARAFDDPDLLLA